LAKVSPKKITISDALLHTELLMLFEKGQTGVWSKTGTYGKIRERYFIAKDRFKKSYDLAYSEWQETRKKADNDQIQANAAESLKSGLKSKIERTLFYQNEIEIMEKQLRGDLSFTFRVGSKMTKSHNKAGNFIAPIEILESIRNTIKSYQCEISKMEGDYAPKKQEVRNTDINGKDIESLIIKGFKFEP